MGQTLETLESGYNNYAWWSDSRLKKDIAPIVSGLEKVRTLRGVTFHWNQLAIDGLASDIASAEETLPDATPGAPKLSPAEPDRRAADLSTTNVGVIAQDVEKVLPEAVTTDAAGYKSVEYRDLIPLLIEAVKEQDTVVAAQAARLTRQQAEIDRLTTAQQATQERLAELTSMKAELGRLAAVVAAGGPISGASRAAADLAVPLAN